jgi:hypothetical protein
MEVRVTERRWVEHPSRSSGPEDAVVQLFLTVQVGDQILHAHDTSTVYVTNRWGRGMLEDHAFSRLAPRILELIKAHA